MTQVRGIRGAIKIRENTRDAILSGARELILAMTQANEIDTGAIAAVFFTVTTDLTADFPAYAARCLGWNDVPMLCATEIPVPGAMSGVLRILMLVNTEVPQDQILHQYVGEAAVLRPDLARSAT